ncbi:hypothetical protein CC80DRAFT_353121, partial [Byssothecium circinans]
DEFLRLQACKEYKPPQEQLDAFAMLLMTEPAVPIADVARCAAAPLLRDGITGVYDRLWGLLFSAVGQLTEYNDKLVQFTVELQKLLPEMPAFDSFCTEMAFPTCDVRPGTANVATERQAITNYHAFIAKLVALDIPFFQHEIRRGGNMLRYTLEAAPWEQYHWADIEDAYASDDSEYEDWKNNQLEIYNVRTLDGVIPAAVEWVKYCGSHMYHQEGELFEYPMRNAKWNGAQGWSKERFAFWRSRFEWVATVTALFMRTKMLAKWAAECM